MTCLRYGRSPIEEWVNKLPKCQFCAPLFQLKSHERHVAHKQTTRYQISISFTQLESSDSWYLPICHFHYWCSETAGWHFVIFASRKHIHLQLNGTFSRLNFGREKRIDSEENLISKWLARHLPSEAEKISAQISILMKVKAERTDEFEFEIGCQSRTNKCP